MEAIKIANLTKAFGELIAVGTPEELKTRLMQEQIIDVQCERPQEAMEAIEHLAGVKEVALFGKGLHVMVEQAETARTAIFLMPVVQTLVFGYAITADVTHVPTTVFDLDNSRASRELVSRFAGSGYFEVVASIDQEEQARELPDRGLVKAILRMNQGFEEDLRAGRTAPLQIILDETDSNTAGIVPGYAGKITGRFSEQVLASRFMKTTGQAVKQARVQLQTRAWFNENLESRNFYVPAMLLSGFVFPIANMPETVQWLTCLNPLRYFLVIVRGIFLKGIGPDILWPQMAALLALGSITLWLAAKRFRKTSA